MGLTVGGAVVGGLARPSNGLTYVLTGLLLIGLTGALTGGSGAGAAGGLPIPVPTPPALRIHGQRSVSVRFGAPLALCLLALGLGFSSSLLEADLSAPATVPKGSLTLYPKMLSPSIEYWRVKFGIVFVGLGDRDGADVTRGAR